MAVYLPQGWPAGVHPPDSPEFERTAIAWLLDVVPPDYRLHGVLIRHPVALAALARHHLDACVTGAREGYRCARTELAGALPPGGITAVLAAYQAEGRRLVATARAVDLVGAALRGEPAARREPIPRREPTVRREPAPRRQPAPGAGGSGRASAAS